jgi:SAM-dependent methyltransferase
MLDYDDEADGYDASRGGEARAAAASAAVERLLPPGARTLVDVGGGTGIVSARLSSPHRRVVVVDRSAGMLALARSRLGGGAVRGDATRLPLRTGCADAVVAIWLLHLLPTAAPMVAEAARLLRPGGVFLTTVDKDDAPFVTPSDLAEVTAAVRQGQAADRTDAAELVARLAAGHGLTPAGQATFVGTGQGRSPRRLLELGFRWVRPVRAAVAGLPEPDRRRPDPVYRLAAFRSTTSTAPTGR